VSNNKTGFKAVARQVQEYALARFFLMISTKSAKDITIPDDYIKDI
jgi:hypothetical protein